ncbi:hypothetical protein DNTS_026872 [Danionella cerebrum]|uniref:B30.2/SPRY domain-containing protein n=1 Tax=Danionella cerebrum TaxID=2873325 RepID=A0A553QE07_9TELE|nr:hypothetical protein DNTS_026872 [Danionella translucida]
MSLLYKISLTNRNTANKTTKKEQEEQEYYFLQWAEYVENTQTNTEKSPFEQLSIKKNTRELLSDWSCQLKDKKPNSVIPKSESEKILKDLHRTWKQGQSSILPVMDWMIWTVLHSESSEDSVARQWIKRSRNFASDTFVPKPAKEGYITGRHYWEVDVNGKSEWRVGVVKESANRNGYVTMNTKAGYWNLRLQLRTLMVLTTPLTKLNMQAPSKIGVYLDMEESLVSFYDALKRRHIYTFNTDFQEFENIYPMFGTVETDRALIISV